MRIICKNEDNFLNMFYGTKNDNYGLNKKEVKIVLNQHIKHLKDIYDFLEGTDIEVEKQFDLGDTINLLEEVRKNIEFEREEN